MRHVSVLLHTAVDTLSLSSGDCAIDATGGSGGHAELLAQKIGKKGKLLVLDQDGDAITRLNEQFSSLPQVLIRKTNFRHIKEVVEELSLPPAQAILFDLGVSSEQIESSGRGFSFLRDEPLLMTQGDDEHIFTAMDIVNTWEEQNIADVIFSYGEEPAARRIAKALVTARRGGLITSSRTLAHIVEGAKGGRHGRIHPATKTFQALRIAVNDELGALKEGLEGAWNALGRGGRIAVITFHGIEARIVKGFLKEKKKEGLCTILTRHAFRATRAEVLANPRARSAS